MLSLALTDMAVASAMKAKHTSTLKLPSSAGRKEGCMTEFDVQLAPPATAVKPVHVRLIFIHVSLQHLYAVRCLGQMTLL